MIEDAHLPVSESCCLPLLAQDGEVFAKGWNSNSSQCPCSCIEFLAVANLESLGLVDLDYKVVFLSRIYKEMDLCS